MSVCLLQELVIEKESRIRESMLMMGLRLWVLWTTWFIKQLLFMSIWVVAYTILFKVVDDGIYTCIYTCSSVVCMEVALHIEMLGQLCHMYTCCTSDILLISMHE